MLKVHAKKTSRLQVKSKGRHLQYKIIAGTSMLAASYCMPAIAGTCAPGWDDSFAPGTPGTFTGPVFAMEYFDEGAGDRLFITGLFAATTSSGVTRGIVRWDGQELSPLGTGLLSTFDNGNALVVHDDGSGPSLFLGGDFSTVGGVPANNIARWDGNQWRALGAGTNGDVNCLAAFDDGNGPALYVGGRFTTAGGGVNVNNIARWDGEGWDPVGTGLQWWNPGEPAWAFAMEKFTDAGGVDRLAVCGSFIYAGGSLARGFAIWDGNSWSVPSGWTVGSYLWELRATTQNGSMRLYLGGENLYLDGQPGHQVLEWDGSVWNALGGGLTGQPGQEIVDVLSIQSFNDGSGEALFVGGYFALADGQPSRGIAKWDGKRWHSLGTGLAGFQPNVDDMIEDRFNQGRPALIVGGQFSHVNGIPMSNIARYLGCYAPCPADLSGDREITTDDLNILLSGFGCTGDPGACPGDIDEDGDTDTTDLNIVLSVFGTSCPR